MENIHEVVIEVKKKVLSSLPDIKMEETIDEHDLLMGAMKEQAYQDILSNFDKILMQVLREKLKDLKLAPENSEMLDHIKNILNFIERIEQRLKFVPTKEQRDNIMFIALGDIQKYVLLGRKFVDLNKFENYWNFTLDRGNGKLRLKYDIV